MSETMFRAQEKPADGSRFAVIVLISYLFPAVAFALIVNVFPGASPLVKYLMTIILSIPWMLLGWWGLRGMGRTLADIGLTGQHTRRALFILLPIWGLYALALLPLVVSHPAPWSELFETSLATIFQQWLFVGLMEEVLFRGYMLNWLRERFAAQGKVLGTGTALVLANLVFSTIHISQRLYQVSQGQMGMDVVINSLLMVFAIGLFFSYVYLRTGNIVLAGLVHGANNAPLFGAQGDLVPLILTVIVIEASLFLQKRMNRQAPLPA